MKNINLKLPSGGYSITVGSGLLERANEYFNLERKVFIVTDSGVPKQYAEKIRAISREAKIFTVEEGEASKSFSVLEMLLSAMLDFGITRSDCIVAVGGGVVGDLSGFAAASYMRGIDFYNVPTTLLAQVDSSIGGKTAINFSGIKNIIGAFYQPKGVLIDTEVLKTLPQRLISAGLAESVKMALTSDRVLFDLLEAEDFSEINAEEIIYRSLLIKRDVVEKDEKEAGLRKILNFGHTLGHGIEAAYASELYHGECVALGMLPMCSPEVRGRLIKVLKKLNLPTKLEGSLETALEFISHDKKCAGDMISIVFVDEVGSYRLNDIKISEFKALIKKGDIL